MQALYKAEYDYAAQTVGVALILALNAAQSSPNAYNPLLFDSG